MKKVWGLLCAVLIALGFAPMAQAVSLHNPVGDRTALAVVHSDGSIQASPNGYQARPALSLSKLYLGYWVMYHGSPEHKAQVEHMIRVSHDGLATQMDSAYPHAIDEIARDFGLSSTYRNGYWGYARTSAVDVSRFIKAIAPDPQAAPIMRGMTNAAPIAADGFPQNFGTSRLPGAQGTKYGWSNDRVSYTASVSTGNGWVAAALTNGPAHDNTADVLHGFANAPQPAQQEVSSVGPMEIPAAPLKDMLPEGSSQIEGLIPDHVMVPTALPALPALP